MRTLIRLQILEKKEVQNTERVKSCHPDGTSSKSRAVNATCDRFERGRCVSVCIQVIRDAILLALLSLLADDGERCRIVHRSRYRKVSDATNCDVVRISRDNGELVLAEGDGATDVAVTDSPGGVRVGVGSPVSCVHAGKDAEVHVAGKGAGVGIPGPASNGTGLHPWSTRVFQSRFASRTSCSMHTSFVSSCAACFRAHQAMLRCTTARNCTSAASRLPFRARLGFGVPALMPSLRPVASKLLVSDLST